MRIGVFDSGLGGLSVLRCLRAELPAATLVYLADQANLPYGAREPEQVRQWTTAAADWLIAQGCGIVVLACNTATAAAVRALRAGRPEVAFVGVEPAIKPAAQHTRSGIVGVLATPGTLAGEHFQQTRQRHAAHVRVIERACVGWVRAVEEGLDGEALHELVAQDVAPLLAAGADCLVLGCTHFPFLAGTIAEIAGDGVRLFDPAPAVARRVASLAGAQARGDGRIEAWTTGEPLQLTRAFERLLGLAVPARKLSWEHGRLRAEQTAQPQPN